MQMQYSVPLSDIHIWELYQHGRLHVLSHSPTYMDASWLLFSSHTPRLSEHLFVRWQSIREELLEQIGIMSLSNVWVTPVITSPSV
jgi:hypothetical protein